MKTKQMPGIYGGRCRKYRLIITHEQFQCGLHYLLFRIITSQLDRLVGAQTKLCTTNLCHPKKN